MNKVFYYGRLFIPILLISCSVDVSKPGEYACENSWHKWEVQGSYSDSKERAVGVIYLSRVDSKSAVLYLSDTSLGIQIKSLISPEYKNCEVKDNGLICVLPITREVVKDPTNGKSWVRQVSQQLSLDFSSKRLISAKEHTHLNMSGEKTSSEKWTYVGTCNKSN